MSQKERGWMQTALVLGAILVMLICCLMGAWLGGITGFVLGSRTAPQSQTVEPYEFEFEYPELPSPWLPEFPDLENLGERPWLGVEFRSVENGAEIVTVIDESPAERVGLQAGDIITAIDGRAITQSYPLNTAILDYLPGDRIALTVLRGDREIELVAQLEGMVVKP